MNDMSSVIIPKSDQINADDFIAGPRTITITDVQIRGGQEQPVSIYFEGSDKAFRPCKSMSRVLVQAWGPDASKYIGRSLTLFRDPTVKWAGMEVGGIRISHMSHIEGRMQMQLTATKGQRKPHIVQPLEAPASKPDKVAEGVRDLLARIAAEDDIAAIEADPAVVKQRAWLAKNRPAAAAEIDAAIAAKQADNPFGEGRDDADMGEAFTDDPPYHQAIEDMKAAIDEATDAATIADIRRDFVARLKPGITDPDVIADMERRFEAAGRALERADG